jgi:hypothetical protein
MITSAAKASRVTGFPAGQLQGTKDDAGIMQILRQASPQTITWNGATSLKTERNPLNSVNAELTVNEVRGPWLLDTGR